MRNFEIAKIFYEMADILEMQNVEWKPQAYRKAARAIEKLDIDIERIYIEGGIKALYEIPGIGEGIAKKIVQYIEKGRIDAYEELKKSIPRGLINLMNVPTIGPKRAKLLYEKLGIENINQLEIAIKQHKVSKLEGMGVLTEKDMLRGIYILKKSKGRNLLSGALLIVAPLVDYLKKSPYINKIELAGSIRRKKETVHDADILVTSKNQKEAIEHFIKYHDIKEVLAKGDTKASVLLENGLQIDIRVVKDESFGAALLYFTGSKDHNIKLRQIAIKLGYKLSEYGLFNKKTGVRIAGKTEEEIYKALGISFIEPEIRENNGEIELAQKGKLPKLIGYNDIKGDLHVHSKYSDGVNTIKQIAIAAKNLGYEYIAICDHSKSQKIAGGIDEDRLMEKIKEIKNLNVQGIKVLSGTEVDIKGDGSLDYSDDVLKKLDIVIAAVHSGFKNSKEKMTDRVIKAMQNKYVQIIGHPTGRLINKREPYAIDLRKVFEVAAETKTALEVNAFPDRLDLNDINIKAAINKGVKIVINTDAHDIAQLSFINFGIAQARRAWAEKKHVLNTYSLEKLMKFLKK